MKIALIKRMEITATTNPYFNFTVFYMDFSFNPYNIFTTAMKLVALSFSFDKWNSDMLQDTQQIRGAVGIWTQWYDYRTFIINIKCRCFCYFQALKSAGILSIPTSWLSDYVELHSLWKRWWL